ncbi:MAG: chemotaxis protein CheW [Sedimenticola sp.]|nr:chemotaxis protein CheW [Sedimenticola sp.]
MSTQETSSEIRGVLLPLQESQLLLPNAAVCEVVSYRAPEALEKETASWLLGTFSWRNNAIPLVSFETLLECDAGTVGHRARVAICNTLNGDESLPYIGILLRSAPHLVRITEEVIAPFNGDDQPNDVVASRVLVNGEEALIPDLDALELMLSDIKF